MSDPIFLTMTGEHHGLVSAGCSSKTSIGRYAQVNHQDQIFALSLLSGWGYEKHSERRCVSFHKFIDKSTPLLALGINENERYFLEFDFYRINQFGHFEKYYFIELRGASIIALQMNFDTRSGHDTECVTLAYDYIRCRHLIAATEYYHFALPANYNSLFSVQNPIVAARNAAQRSVPKVNVSKPFGTVKTPAPTITPVFAKSCLRGAGCTDAGTSEEPAENFGQMAIFAQPIADDCCGYAQEERVDPVQTQRGSAGAGPLPVATASTDVLGGGLLAAQAAIARMTQVWGSWSPSGTLGVARGIPYVGVLASALYIPSAGEGSDRPPGRSEFWLEEELRQKAKATTRVRFFWRPNSQGKMQVYGVHTGEGTPYEGVRVALMTWAEKNRRYEFTPAGSVDGPLITWTPETPAGTVGPFDTGHDVKPIDQATILVTPIPTGEDEYTTPAFPVPHERDLNDYILVFPADAGIEPIYVYLKTARNEPGTATGKGEVLAEGSPWLNAASTGIGAPIPAQVADKLIGRSFRNFDHFREEFWLAVAQCPELMKQFSRANQINILGGNAPFSVPSEQVGNRKRVEIHHIDLIKDGGAVYDMENMSVNTVKNHIRIHINK